MLTMLGQVVIYSGLKTSQLLMDSSWFSGRSIIDPDARSGPLWARLQ